MPGRWPGRRSIIATVDNRNVAFWSSTGAQSFSRNHAYDNVNRLLAFSASSDDPTSCTGLSWTDDQRGNRTNQTVTGGTCGIFDQTVNTNNQFNSLPYQYEAAGNMKYDGNHYYYYDAENRLIQVDGTLGTCSTATACYAYDYAGRRVQRTLSGGTPANYLYDLDGRVNSEIDLAQGSFDNSNHKLGWVASYIYLGGSLLAEYANSTTYFVHKDHLGSTRLLTDMTGCVVDNLDYLPYGELYSYTPSCSAPDIALKFTGKERDSESNLDNFGARYDSSQYGGFMTPDSFFKDSHVGDPKSWNEYAYARNNPLRYTDPTGQNATVSTNCTTDDNNHTTCNVNISASIAIYAASGSNLTQSQLNSAASTIQSSIQNAWSGTVTQDGVPYNISTQVSVSVAGSQDAAMNSGAQNVIGMTNGPPKEGAGAYVSAKSVIGALTGAADTGMMDINGADNYAKHEFTHLLGTDDKPGAVLSDTDPAMRPDRATAQDLGWGIREAVNSVNMSRSMISNCGAYCGAVPANPRISTTDTVGAPWHWWK